MCRSRNKVVKLLIGTCEKVLQNMINGDYNPIVWASDNLETVAHYWDGTTIELEVLLDQSVKQDYYAGDTPLKYQHTWGCAEMLCPKNATWFSFSKEYLEQNLVSVREVFPDLSPWSGESEEI